MVPEKDLQFLRYPSKLGANMLSQTIDQQLFWFVKKAPKTILQLYALLIEKIPKKCDIDEEE